MNDLSNSNAAKKRLCCVCGKYCLDDEIYFSKTVECLNCYTLQDYLAFREKNRYFIIPVAVRENI